MTVTVGQPVSRRYTAADGHFAFCSTAEEKELKMNQRWVFEACDFAPHLFSSSLFLSPSLSVSLTLFLNPGVCYYGAKYRVSVFKIALETFFCQARWAGDGLAT